MDLSPRSGDQSRWIYLERRPRSKHQQLYVIGKPFKALDVYEEIVATRQTDDEAARMWNLPIEAIREITRYCQANQELLKQESFEEHIRIESRHRLRANARRSARIISTVLIALLPILLIFSVRDWILYVLCALLFIAFLRFVKDWPIVGKAWISFFGDNSIFEWIKVTVIPISVLFLGASITNAINSRQSEANVEKSRYEIAQKYLDLFSPANQSRVSIEELKRSILADRKSQAPLLHVNGGYRLPSRCYAYPESAWLSNQTNLALTELTGMQLSSKGVTAQKRYILQFIQREGLIRVGSNVISLRLADLSDSNLMMADLRDSCLESVLFSDYSGTPGSGSDLRHAHLDRSDLTGANLKHVNLRGASMRGVDLRGFASLRNSDLRGADLTDALMDRSTVVTGARMNTVAIDIDRRKKSSLYSFFCMSGLRHLFRRTYYCLDNIDYKTLEATRLPRFCSASGCVPMTSDAMRRRGVIIDNHLPVQ